MRREILVLVLVATAAGCGLINAITGDGDDGGIVCDVDGICLCVDAPDTLCIGDGCRCDDDGLIACSGIDTICSLIDDDGCANDACVCHDEGSGACNCEDAPGACSTDSGSIVLTDDSGEGCVGNCSCSISEGCSCLGSDCVYTVDGALCSADIDCQLLQMATSTGCDTSRDCAAGEFCADVADGETGCFVSGGDDDGCATLDTRDGGEEKVCVNALAVATCDAGQCAGSISP